MQIVDFKGKKWVIGLDWEVLPGNKTIKAEIKDVAISEKKAYGVLITQGMSENQHSGQGGKFVAIGLSNKPSKYPSAALSLALANDAETNSASEFDYKTDWIVIEELPNDRYWMVGISKNIPLPQTDVILDRTSLVEKINNLLQNDVFKIFSTSAEIREVYEGRKEIINKGINDLTADIHTKTKFKKLTGIPTNVMIAGAVAIAITVGYLGFQTYSESALAQKQREEVAARAAAEEEARQREYDEQMRQYKIAYEEAKNNAVSSVVNGLSGDPNKLLNAFYQVVGDFNFGSSGWKIERINCQFNHALDKKANCVINFKRTGLTTNRMLLQDYPDAVINGDSASVSRAVIASSDTFKVPSLSILDQLPTAKTWGFDMISQLQLLKIVKVNHIVSSSSEIFFTPPAKPLNEQEKSGGLIQETPVPVSIGIASGSIELNSDNFIILREVADNIDFKSVGVTNVDFFMENNKLSWKVLMNYYVKNGDGVIGASDSRSLPATNVKDKKEENLNDQPIIIK